MRTIPLSLVCFVSAGFALSGCASTGSVSAEAGTGVNAPHHPVAAIAQLTSNSPLSAGAGTRAGTSTEVVREVDAVPVADDPRPVCRREPMTGSRIMRQRCEYPAMEAQRRLNQEMLDYEINRSHELAIMMEQQRIEQQQAIAEERRRMEEAMRNR